MRASPNIRFSCFKCPSNTEVSIGEWMQMIETEKITFKGLMHGQFSKRFLTHKYLPLIYLQLSLFFLLAYAFYENYNFIRMDISFLGEPKKNPAGWYFWAIGMFFTGILVFPPIEYFYFRIRHLNKPIAIITRFLLILFGIGMIGLGAIPQYQNLTVYQDRKSVV